ncbi:dipeptide/oligopeptide/nickel ABC transporter permease/ATP-binding protein [Labedella endophytica]|uniref:Dipeptide/oligopeptide/nickel ABC transporter permease/ATP-binding protein n=1 Tax=Labedella endophytica TaxID=1523160 RepID=A0A433JUD2_9MICO|nr:dipeptide/oligopeptide/nickel ABC transporter permease/ATP-binding protein [Labedella endophytica]RUR01804.1 dipeptide/oligopeptide/nickel ABC transporter permease/ATP-binding protein [Labedella endophytica]
MTSPSPIAGVVAATATDPARRGVLRVLLRNPLALASLVVLVLVVVVSIAAPLLAPFGPNEVVPGLARQGPEAGHLLGGDGAGRDVLSRLLFAGRLTLIGTVVTLVVAVVVGVPAGMLAGYYGSWWDSVSSWGANIVIAIPGMVLLLAVIAAIGPQTIPVMAMFGILLSPGFFRLARTAVQNVRNELYVDAARVSGLSDARIIARHVFGVVRGPLIIQASFSAGAAVLVQTGLQFLGLGEQGTPSWGQMLSDAFTNIYAAPHLVFPPGITIAITVASLALVGNALRDSVNGRSAPSRARRVPPEAPADPTPDDTSLLVVRGMQIGYPAGNGVSVVVDDVGFSIAAGEVVGLVGESGSGKSQTAFSILGLLPPEASIRRGIVHFDGRDLLAASPTERARLRGSRIAYIPQEPMSNLDPSFTIGAQLTEPLRAVRGLSRSAARARALELLEEVGIADPARTFASYPHQISGGMAQRVLIAGAVSCDPALLIADEPTTALDVTVQAEILDLLRRLQEERGMAVLLVTHNFGVVADLCQRVVVMRTGRVVEEGDVTAVFADPREDYTKQLLSAIPNGTRLRAPVVPVSRRKTS